MSYVPTGFTPEQEALVIDRVTKMVELQEKEARDRKLALAFGIAGAFFAAVRLGVIFAPKVRRRKAVTP